jgi:hypothetical protein
MVGTPASYAGVTGLKSPARRLAILFEGFRGFSPSLQVDVGIVP